MACNLLARLLLSLLEEGDGAVGKVAPSPEVDHPARRCPPVSPV